MSSPKPREDDTSAPKPGTWEHYALASAVRGPDVQTSTSALLKELITARVRAILGYTCACHVRMGLVEHRPMSSSELEAISGAPFEYVRKHYLGHLLDAVAVSNTHPIWGGRGEELQAVLMEAWEAPTEAEAD